MLRCADEGGRRADLGSRIGMKMPDARDMGDGLLLLLPACVRGRDVGSEHRHRLGPSVRRCYNRSERLTMMCVCVWNECGMGE